MMEACAALFQMNRLRPNELDGFAAQRQRQLASSGPKRGGWGGRDQLPDEPADLGLLPDGNILCNLTHPVQVHLEVC